MGVVHVKGHRWPATIESILSRTTHAPLKETALSVRSSRFIPSLAEFCAYIDEAKAVICGLPDLLIHDLRSRSTYLVELKIAPTFGDYTPFIKASAIKPAIHSWLLNNYYAETLDAVLHPICIRVTDTIRSFITNA
jgi:hypothetical protein